MFSFTLLMILAGLSSLALGLVVAFLIYVAVKYAPKVGRVFEEKPLLLPLRLSPVEGGEDVRFTTTDGLELAGTYFRARTATRVGVMVFCHEFLSNRWSYRPYADHLRDLGYDLFLFDFRNHGASASAPAYQPLQWVTDHEVRDLSAALDYLRGRPDHDRAGFGLYGISRGGGTALVVGARERDVWGVITDGAFPTNGTMLSYIVRWAEIYVGNRFIWSHMPLGVFRFAAWAGRVRSERRLRCRFPNVERSVGQLAPRPWLMIHGEKDAYIGLKIAHAFFQEAGAPKEMWVVPRAKHNRCRQVDPAAYEARLTDFLGRFAPRRAVKRVAARQSTDQNSVGRGSMPMTLVVNLDTVATAPPLAGELVAPVSG